MFRMLLAEASVVYKSFQRFRVNFDECWKKPFMIKFWAQIKQAGPNSQRFDT